jgi:ferredoxin-NADP reductase
MAWRHARPSPWRGIGRGALMAMLRLAHRTGRSDLAHLIVSTRTPEDLYYAAELAQLQETVLYARRAPYGWPRPAGPAHDG